MKNPSRSAKKSFGADNLVKLSGWASIDHFSRLFIDKFHEMEAISVTSVDFVDEGGFEVYSTISFSVN